MTPAALTGLDLLATAVILVDTDDVLRHMNPAAENLLELSHANVVGQSIAEVFTGKQIDDLIPPVQRRETPNQRVWLWVNGQLKAVSGIRTGISDGQFTEMVTGELKEGDKVVTNFVNPSAPKATASISASVKGMGVGAGIGCRS